MSTDSEHPNVRYLYAVVSVQDFEGLQITVVDRRGLPVPGLRQRLSPTQFEVADDLPAPTHYLPVFDTIEAAYSWSSDGTHQVLRLVMPAHEHTEEQVVALVD